MNQQIAVLHETGLPQTSVEGESKQAQLVITAIVTAADRFSELEQEAEELLRQHPFALARTSWDGTGADIGRIKMLTALRTLPFHVFAVVVDLRQLRKVGAVASKRSVDEFLNKLVHDELFRAFPNLEIIRLEPGRYPFLESFQRYVEQAHIPNLFNEFSFGFSNRKSGVLSEFTELIGETLAGDWGGKDGVKTDGRFFKMLQEKIVGLREWPRASTVDRPDGRQLLENAYHEVIAKQAVRIAEDFIQGHADAEDGEIKDQVNFIRFLLFKLRFMNPQQYVATEEIARNLNAFREKPLNRHYLRSRIVARLRDQGVLIASSDYGYKIPISERDLDDFVNHFNSIVMPMLHRVGKYRDLLLQATDGRFDMLDGAEYDQLRRFFEDHE